MRSKLKTELLEKYIKLINIENINKNVDISTLEANYQNQFISTCRLIDRLKSVYERLFFKFDVMDDAFLVLKSELARVKFMQSPVNLGLIEENHDFVLTMCGELNSIFKKLSLNDCERKYIVYEVLCEL